MNASRPRLLLVALYAGLLVLLVVCGLRLVRSRKGAEAAASNFESCKQSADQIEMLRAIPTHASLHRQSAQDLALKIEQAAQIAGISGSAILRINPQVARRVRKSPHLQQPTNIEIRQITLEQLTRFLRELSSSDSGLRATSLRLTAPRVPAKDQQHETWSVEVVLTHLVFSPEYAAPSSQVATPVSSE